MSTAVRAIPPSINGWNAQYIEDQYNRFRADPASVPDDIRAFLHGFDLAMAAPRAQGTAPAAPTDARAAIAFALAVRGLVHAFRTNGHLAADLNPFGPGTTISPEQLRPHVPVGALDSLELSAHGLQPADLAKPAIGHGLPLPENATLQQVVDFLRARYTASTAWQFMHLTDPAARLWWQQKAEADNTQPTHDERLQIVELLCRSEHLDEFLQKRYQGQKRFSLEGSESLIPLMEWLMLAAADTGVAETIIGMAHRGRMNVLNIVMGKSYQQIFTDFEHNYREEFIDGGGDVKYHKGFSSERVLRSGKDMQLSLMFNPSHLEAVNPLVCGKARAKQRLRGDTKRRNSVLPVMIHGDAALIGQGVGAELLNMSRLDGYKTGGSVHIVTNNLIGFTTDPRDGRSSPYCTDFALGCDCPVIHVNGDDPEAAVRAARLAAQFRAEFARDVFIDLYGYRKYGHNEADNAAFTQPILAALIKADDKKGVLDRYTGRLEQAGLVKKTEIAALKERLDVDVNKAQEEVKLDPAKPVVDPGLGRWVGMVHDYSHAPAKTGVSAELLREVCKTLGNMPEGFTINPTLKKIVDARAALADLIGSKDPTPHLSYADGETLAFGTLLLEGTPVRISGEDSRRGTFSHRHVLLRDFQTGEAFMPLNAMRPITEFPYDVKSADDRGAKDSTGQYIQARLCVYNSPLSEYAVMGFDFGYSMADPHMLVCWEAQFGDFANGAQIIIDQFLAATEIKWDRWSGITLLLPHGYEGQGPEHSSARIERFLQLCGNDSMQIVYPSTGAQIFHLLRRQVRRNFRKPLVIFTPKSKLRLLSSRMDDLITGTFQDALDDPMFIAGPDKRKLVKRVILTAGKMYHDLAERRAAVGRTDTALVRIEQFYPLNHELIKKILGQYPSSAELYWAQEEPRNMGAFLFLDDAFRHELGKPGLKYLGRPASATCASGDTHQNDEQQDAILTAAIGPIPAVNRDHQHAPKPAPKR